MSEGITDAGHLDVVGLGHLVQQVQGLVLECFIGILQAVYDSHLVLGCIFGIDAHNPCKRINADILQVVAAGLQELANGLRSCRSHAQGTVSRAAKT